MSTLDQPKELVTLRVSRLLADEVRQIAEREDESQSTILRRLLRFGLNSQRQRAALNGDEAA
jgi:hypothetical protein